MTADQDMIKLIYDFFKLILPQVETYLGVPWMSKMGSFTEITKSY